MIVLGDKAFMEVIKINEVIKRNMREYSLSLPPFFPCSLPSYLHSFNIFNTFGYGGERPRPLPSIPKCEDKVRRLQARKTALWHFDLGLLGSRTMRI